MSKHRAGVIVVGEKVTVVHAEVPDDESSPIIVISDNTWTLQQGGRGAALAVLHQRCQNFCEEHNLEAVVIKASSLSLNGMRLAALESAEVRGVVIAAAASKTKVEILSKAKISRTYGERKVDEYLKDNSFWEEKTSGVKLKIASREATMLIIASREA
jgi:hypothetical protein